MILYLLLQPSNIISFSREGMSNCMYLHFYSFYSFFLMFQDFFFFHFLSILRTAFKHSLRVFLLATLEICCAYIHISEAFQTPWFLMNNPLNLNCFSPITKVLFLLCCFQDFQKFDYDVSWHGFL